MKDFGFYLVITNPVVGYVKCAEAAVRAGVKVIQLRMKHASREEILREGDEPLGQADVLVSAVFRGLARRFHRPDIRFRIH